MAAISVLGTTVELLTSDRGAVKPVTPIYEGPRRVLDSLPMLERVRAASRSVTTAESRVARAVLADPIRNPASVGHTCSTPFYVLLALNRPRAQDALAGTADVLIEQRI